jgi:hypothetical protein
VFHNDRISKSIHRLVFVMETMNFLSDENCTFKYYLVEWNAPMGYALIICNKWNWSSIYVVTSNCQTSVL